MKRYESKTFAKEMSLAVRTASYPRVFDGVTTFEDRCKAMRTIILNSGLADRAIVRSKSITFREAFADTYGEPLEQPTTEQTSWV